MEYKDDDCLIDIVTEADSIADGFHHDMEIVRTLAEHVVVASEDGADIELACKRCPATCTLKNVGGMVISLLHSREVCPESEMNDANH